MEGLIVMMTSVKIVYIYIISILKYTKAIMIIMMIIVSFDDDDDDHDHEHDHEHDDNCVLYFIYFDAHYVCFTDSSADTSQHRHEITGSATHQELRND